MDNKSSKTTEIISTIQLDDKLKQHLLLFDEDIIVTYDHDKVRMIDNDKKEITILNNLKHCADKIIYHSYIVKRYNNLLLIKCYNGYDLAAYANDTTKMYIYLYDITQRKLVFNSDDCIEKCNGLVYEHQLKNFIDLKNHIIIATERYNECGRQGPAIYVLNKINNNLACYELECVVKTIDDDILVTDYNIYRLGNDNNTLIDSIEYLYTKFSDKDKYTYYTFDYISQKITVKKIIK